MDNAIEEAPAPRTIGFWGAWSLTVGVMIGSGIFLLPSVMAPYGLMGFSGWVLTAAGSILLALVMSRLALRTTRSGGPYIYAREAFGDLPGFLVIWGYWASYWIAIPTVAIAFVGYLGVFFPELDQAPIARAGVALGLIWLLGIVSLRGVREASLVQLGMTLLKLLPILAIIGYGAVAGHVENLPEINPSGQPFLPVLATTALLTMWAFSGLECATIPAGDVRDPQKTIPRATMIGTITVATVYIASTAAVMLLVPASELVDSTSPFSDAARGLGPWAPKMVAIGALISTAGCLNGLIFIAGQLPMAVAIDKLAPKAFAKRNSRGAPQLSLLVSLILGSALLLANFSDSLIDTFEFLLMMSTVTILLPLLVSALAELRHSWASARSWAIIAILATLYSAFAIYGSGLEVMFWGMVLMLVGLPVYVFGRQRKADEVSPSAPAD
ncbi:APC family permease [Maricaulis sp.]|uniref:APC family permease n=1 Tax=Maricaulis sp. TaxID=1486257 RepID=UPI003A929CB5